MLVNFIFVVIFFCFSVHAGRGFKNTTDGARPKPLWSQTIVDKLKKDLLTNYDKYARPQEHKNLTRVKVGMSIMNVATEESKSAVIVSAMMRLYWNDDKLKWNESDYGGLSVLRISDHEIWQPDIHLYNSASGSSQLQRYGNPNMLVFENGEVQWVPPVKLTALCDFDMTYWPFDVQHCQLKFGSWVYSGNEITLGLDKNSSESMLEKTANVSEWYIDTSAYIDIKKYNCCEESYYSVFYNLTLTRKAKSYTAAFVTPAVVCTFFTLFQFWLPPAASEKIFLNSFVFIILNMFLIFLNHKVIGVGSKAPLIVIFYSRCLWINTFTTLVAIAMYSFSNIQKTIPVPMLLHKFLQTKIGQFTYLEFDVSENLLCKKTNPGDTSDGVSEARRFSEFAETNKLSIAQQWHVLAVVVDRIFFLICTVAFLILAILYA